MAGMDARLVNIELWATTISPMSNIPSISILSVFMSIEYIQAPKIVHVRSPSSVDPASSWIIRHVNSTWKATGSAPSMADADTITLHVRFNIANLGPGTYTTNTMTFIIHRPQMHSDATINGADVVLCVNDTHITWRDLIDAVPVDDIRLRIVENRGVATKLSTMFQSKVALYASVDRMRAIDDPPAQISSVIERGYEVALYTQVSLWAKWKWRGPVFTHTWFEVMLISVLFMRRCTEAQYRKEGFNPTMVIHDMARMMALHQLDRDSNPDHERFIQWSYHGWMTIIHGPPPPPNTITEVLYRRVQMTGLPMVVYGTAIGTKADPYTGMVINGTDESFLYGLPVCDRIPLMSQYRTPLYPLYDTPASPVQIYAGYYCEVDTQLEFCLIKANPISTWMGRISMDISPVSTDVGSEAEEWIWNNYSTPLVSGDPDSPTLPSAYIQFSHQPMFFKTVHEMTTKLASEHSIPYLALRCGIVAMN